MPIELHFRRYSLRTASNRLLISVLIADFYLLSNGYLTIFNNLKGYPVLGVLGKMSNDI